MGKGSREVYPLTLKPVRINRGQSQNRDKRVHVRVIRVLFRGIEPIEEDVPSDPELGIL